MPKAPRMAPAKHGNARKSGPSGGSRPARGQSGGDKGRRDSGAVDPQRLLYGVHAIRAAIQNPDRRFRAIHGTESGLSAISDSLEAALGHGLKRPTPARTPPDRLDAMAGPGAVHQGIVALVEPLDPPPLEDVVEGLAASSSQSAPSPVLVMLDQVTDPQNIGAIFRSSAAFGAAGVIVQDRHAPPLTAAAAKIASGAADRIPLIRVTNLARSLRSLKDQGFRAIGLAEDSDVPLPSIDLSGPLVLVMGAEGPGLRRLVGESCDILARLPTMNDAASLNVAHATSIALYEARRARSTAPGAPAD